MKIAGLFSSWFGTGPGRSKIGCVVLFNTFCSDPDSNFLYSVNPYPSVKWPLQSNISYCRSGTREFNNLHWGMYFCLGHS